MAGGNGPANGGRVTTAQFYKAQLETNKEIADMALRQSEERSQMEIRILEKLDGLPTQVETNKDEIDKLRKNSNIKDWTIGIGAAIGTAISIAIGWNK